MAITLTIIEVIRRNGIQIGAILGSIALVIAAIAIHSISYLALIPVMVCGAPILVDVLMDIEDGRVSAEALVISAIFGCVMLEEYVAAAEIAAIMSIGNLLEKSVTEYANAGMDALKNLRADTASLIDGDTIKQVRTESVSAGSLVRVFPGGLIPLDGTIVFGASSIDRSAVTGESVPADVREGDAVLAGTVNLDGTIDVRVDRADSDSYVSHMAELLEKAAAGKSIIASMADRASKYVLLGAAMIAIATLVLTGDAYRALTVMVVFCPCAFVLATPTAIMAMAGNMARHGILLKSASAVEGMAKTKAVLFDKTGTLTEGKMVFRGFTGTDDIDEGLVTGMVSALESRSDHPLGKALSACAPIGAVETFENVPGQGVVGTVDGVRLAVGNRRLMERLCPENLGKAYEAASRSSAITVFVGMDGRTVGFISLADSVKDSSVEAVSELRSLGVATVMLTGDSESVATEVRERLGLDDLVWECTPDAKIRAVEHFESDGPACMVGDGINDAPALRRASVGISMGSIGNSLAVSSSDVVFLNDDLRKLPGLLRLSKRSVRTIAAGLVTSMCVNVAGTALAMIGVIGPATGALIHNVGSLAVVLLMVSLLWSPDLSRSPKLSPPRFGTGIRRSLINEVPLAAPPADRQTDSRSHSSLVTCVLAAMRTTVRSIIGDVRNRHRIHRLCGLWRVRRRGQSFAEARGTNPRFYSLITSFVSADGIRSINRPQHACFDTPYISFQ